MSQDFFKKYFLVNISDSKGLKPLLFVMLYIDAQAAVQQDLDFISKVSIFLSYI